MKVKQIVVTTNRAVLISGRTFIVPIGYDYVAVDMLGLVCAYTLQPTSEFHSSWDSSGDECCLGRLKRHYPVSWETSLIRLEA